MNPDSDVTEAELVRKLGDAAAAGAETLEEFAQALLEDYEIRRRTE
jgi:hypothetical protein